MQGSPFRVEKTDSSYQRDRVFVNQFKHHLDMEPKSSRTTIDARNLTRIYALGGSEVIGINMIDLRIDAGELVILKGNSGSGKSTLLSLLAGLDRPTRGELTVADHNLTTATPANLTHFRREVVGMVFQAFNLMPTLNVLKMPAFPDCWPGKIPLPSRQRQCNYWTGSASAGGGITFRLNYPVVKCSAQRLPER